MFHKKGRTTWQTEEIIAISISERKGQKNIILNPPISFVDHGMEEMLMQGNWHQSNPAYLVSQY